MTRRQKINWTLLLAAISALATAFLFLVTNSFGAGQKYENLVTKQHLRELNYVTHAEIDPQLEQLRKGQDSANQKLDVLNERTAKSTGMLEQLVRMVHE
jgi:hypothetical protein